MIKHRVARVGIGFLAAGALTACAAPASGPSGPSGPAGSGPSGAAEPSATAVAPGCDLSGDHVRWSKPTRGSRLTKVTLFRSLRADTAGQDLFDEPFAPTISRVAAPPEWTGQLAKSLSAKTGRKVQSGTTGLKDGGYGTTMGGQDDAGISEALLYQGVETVSATFSVTCDRPVTGIFTSWTAPAFGGLQCGQIEQPADQLGRLARRYCPRTPAPQLSSFDAVPFPPD